MAQIKVVTGNRYTAEDLYQWDKNQVLEIYGLSLSSIPQIHFANNNMDKAIVRESTMDDAGVIRVVVPNSLLQVAAPINVYVCEYGGSEFNSLYHLVIKVKGRAKPSDYSLENDEEVYSFIALENLFTNALAVSLARYAEVNAKYEQTEARYNQACDKMDQANAALDEAIDAATDAKTASQSAQAKAETAQSKAEAAQAKAETAQSKAETAKAGAETAQSSASASATTAQTAATSAAAAQSGAETAKAGAESARDDAEIALAGCEALVENAALTVDSTVVDAGTNAVNSVAVINYVDERFAAIVSFEEVAF